MTLSVVICHYMSLAHIRLARTPEVDKVISYLRIQYTLLSDAEIVKLALSEKYQKEIKDLPLVDEETEKLIAKGLEDYKNGRYTAIKTDAELDKYLKSL